MSRLTYKFLRRTRGRVCALRAAGVQIGSGCRILSDIATTEPWLISVGDRVTISSGVTFITHDGSGWLYRDIRGRRFRFAPISVGSDVFIGAGVTVLPGVSIGDRCVVGAGSVVTASVPAESVVAGVPARPIKAWPEFYAGLSRWSAATDMVGQTYRERVDSIAEALPVQDGTTQAFTKPAL
ncbi:DapH/DapD/GlmU-related protein [Cryobacterium sp. Y11]|uniref:acyltransferase n=1 Tax=Cryobacterium sp. Y11 TaxID=2045016 RepID=UPI000CE522FD|nr:acyltransferase [Cryobacterium sp. Y11]